MALSGFWLQPTIVKIDAMSQGVTLGPATGFIIDYRGDWYLVSAWHVFSGRDLWTGQPILKIGAIPDSFNLTFNVEAKNEAGRPIGVTTRVVQTSLHNNEGEARWLQHCEHG